MLLTVVVSAILIAVLNQTSTNVVVPDIRQILRQARGMSDG